MFTGMVMPMQMCILMFMLIFHEQEPKMGMDLDTKMDTGMIANANTNKNIDTNPITYVNSFRLSPGVEVIFSRYVLFSPTDTAIEYLKSNFISRIAFFTFKKFSSCQI